MHAEFPVYYVSNPLSKVVNEFAVVDELCVDNKVQKVKEKNISELK